MPSPFPGMDPYLEACGLWEDFHTKLIGDLERTLSATLSERYLVRTGERSYIVLAKEDGKEAHFFLPDVGLKTLGPLDRPTAEETPTALAEPATEPVELRAFVEEEFRETFVEIYEADAEQRLVTSIEVLSPSNKRPGTIGWKRYLRKRQAVLQGETSLVELDLLRGGTRMPMVDPWPTSPYTLLVGRRGRWGRCCVWPAFSLRPLPVLPIPLLKPDPDVLLPLQSMVEAIYQRSRYERTIDYSRPLQPPLRDDEAAWLREQIALRQAMTAGPS